MRRILLVDDDFAVLDVTKLVLEHEGFEVITATNGEEALAAARAERPDLIVTDYMMPIMNGAELIKKLRAIPPFALTPIIMVSATPPNEIGPVDQQLVFLPKPVTVRGLLGSIRELLPRSSGDDPGDA